MDVIQDNVKIKLAFAGNGYEGKYDPKDECDDKLLELTVHKKKGKRWLKQADGTITTQLTSDLSKELISSALLLCLRYIYDVAESGGDLTGVCADLSHMVVDVDGEGRYNIKLTT